MTIRQTRFWGLSFIFVLAVLLFLPGTSFAKLVAIRDPRAGLLDADLVVIVRQVEKDQFQIEQVFFGKSYAVDVIGLPEFRLFTEHEDGPTIVEPITPDTRILLFLKHKEKDKNAWEITAYGNCFFWVQSLDKVNDLQKMAEDAVALRKSWEAARDEHNEKSRIEVLWPYLWNNNGYFFLQTEAELKKVGPAAGDYIAQQLDSMTPNHRVRLLSDIAEYGSKGAHSALLKLLKGRQQTYEEFFETRDPNAKSIIDNWNALPEEIKNIYGELYYGLSGLAKFKDRSDLPYIRELALWCVKYRVKQTCEAALKAFEYMPDRPNLAVIESINRLFFMTPHDGDGVIPYDIVRPLLAHNMYPETIPMLIPFLDDSFSDETVYQALKKLTGVDKGKNSKDWMDWYGTQKRSK